MPIQGISHVIFVVRDLERSSRLFCEGLGAHEVYDSKGRNFSILLCMPGDAVPGVPTLIECTGVDDNWQNARDRGIAARNPLFFPPGRPD